MIDTKESLVGNISQEQEVNGAVNKGIEIIQPTLQEKTTTPTEQIQQITPDENYDGLSQVTVNAIPSQYIVPTGTLNITTNGNYNVTNYETANVQTSGADLSEYFYTEITENTSSSSNMNTKIVKKYVVDVSNNVTTLESAYNSARFGGGNFNINFNSNVTNLYNMFYNATSIDSIDLSNCNSSNVTNMSRTFMGPTSSYAFLDTLNTIIFGNNFNTDKATTMQNMFAQRRNLTTLDLSSFTSTALTNTNNMFGTCPALTHIDMRNMSFSSVTNSGGMFSGVPANCEIIVKDATAKAWVLNVRSDLTNVKTVAEYEGE